MGIPCLTLRDNTEHPETITIGTNELIGTGSKGDSACTKKAVCRRMEKREHS